MYNLLIVEDEPLELAALKEIVGQNMNCFDEIETMDNGEDVQDLLQFSSPDIVLMDIHLGNYNGIDLSKTILEHNPDARIIIISAYEEFAYAQNAIKLGISDYLLKPVSTVKLLEAITKQVDYLCARRQSLLQQVKLKENLSVLKESFFSSFLAGVINPSIHSTSYELLEQFIIPHENMYISILRPNLQYFELTESETFIIKTMLADKLKETVTDFILLYDVLGTEDIVFSFFFSANEQPNISSILESFLRIIKSEFHIPVRISSSECIKNPKDLFLAYRHALSILQFSSDQICIFDDFLSESEPFHTVENVSPMLIGHLLSSDSQTLADEIDRFHDRTMSTSNEFSQTKAAYVTLWVDLRQDIEAKLMIHGTNDLGDLTEQISRFLTARSVMDLKKTLKEYFDDLAQKINTMRNDKTNHMVHRADHYIREHFAEPLTLQSIADALHASQYYLCHIFKNTLNTGVIGYLNEFRVEEAKKLLASTHLSIKDIALKTGFADANYFCRVFKRTTGTTPTGFKTLNKASPE